jgi:hypothetical protein
MGSRPFMPDPTLTWLFFALCRYVESQRLLPIQNGGEPDLLTEPFPAETNSGNSDNKQRSSVFRVSVK